MTDRPISKEEAREILARLKVSLAAHTMPTGPTEQQRSDHEARVRAQASAMLKTPLPRPPLHDRLDAIFEGEQ